MQRPTDASTDERQGRGALHHRARRRRRARRVDAGGARGRGGGPDRGCHRHGGGRSPRDATAEALWRREQALLDRMQEIAEKSRHLPDAKTRR